VQKYNMLPLWFIILNEKRDSPLNKKRSHACWFQHQYHNLVDRQEKEYENPTDLQQKGSKYMR